MFAFSQTARQNRLFLIIHSFKMLLNYSQLSFHENSLPIVVIHGLFGSKENLNVIAKPLSEKHTVINVDVRNHGLSFHCEEMTYALMADDIVQLLNHLNYRNCILIGHSMGGKIAMQVALNHPELVKKLVVLDIAPTHYLGRHQAIFDGLLSIDTKTLSNRNDADSQLNDKIQEPGVRQFLLKSLAKSENGFLWRFNLKAIIANYENILKKPTGNIFTKETLFIKGANSDYITTEHRQEIAALFPNSKAKIIVGAGHWLHAEKPSQVNLAISQFLEH